MVRKSMCVVELNNLMKKIKNEKYAVRYITFTIHPHASIVTSVVIHTTDDSHEFNITNNPDEHFDLNKAVNEFVDALKY